MATVVLPIPPGPTMLTNREASAVSIGGERCHPGLSMRPTWPATSEADGRQGVRPMATGLLYGTCRRRDKRIASARDVYNVAGPFTSITKRLPKGGEMNAEVGVLYRHIRPDA